jgi:alpha-L-fucosidase
MNNRQTRRDFLSGAVAASIYGALPKEYALAQQVLSRSLPLPTASHLKWADMELGMFYHYDIPIFGGGKIPDPKRYNPYKLDTDQWMEAAKAYGAKYVVLTAKHGAGFMQWQSDIYPYGVKQSSWRGGKGDLVKDFVESARKYGLKPGLYVALHYNAFLGVRRSNGLVSHKGYYGIGPEAQLKYKNSCEAVLTELLTKYGEMFEIWFDGGVREPSQGGPRALEIIERLQPNAILFQGPKKAKNIIRWIGNERGVAPYPCWATGLDVTQSDGVKESRSMLNTGTPDGQKWMPGECDVPLKVGGWMCTDKGRYWRMDELMNMYDCSVGRNCNLILNAAPQPDGLIAEHEMKMYAEFGKRIKARYSNKLCAVNGEGDTFELAVPKDKGPVNQIVLMEQIKHGERVRKFSLEAKVAGEWKKVYSGSCIGHKHIVRFADVAAEKIKLTITSSAATPLIRDFSAYRN